MGYGLPAAIGAKLGAPAKRVVLFVGDGGFQMSLSELGTLKQCNIPIIIVLLNNNCLGMVREIQASKYNNPFGIDLSSNPDFVKLAEAYGIKSRRVDKESELEEAFSEAISCETAFLLELVVDPEEGTLK